MHDCDRLKALIDRLPNGSLKNELLAVYNKHCGTISTQDSGGGGNGGGDPPK